MPSKPRAMILTGYGINCDEETQFAFQQAGAVADIVHVNDVIAGKKSLDDYHILAFPGGFSYGDNLGSGNAFANKIRNNMWDALERFVRAEKLVIGICNGCQIIANLGLIPARGNRFGEKQVTLMHNDNHRYTCRWVDVKVTNASPWLKGIQSMQLPIAHGEGKFWADEKMMQEIKENNHIALQYFQGPISSGQNLAFNPNGSLWDIAALTDASGRILGMMPHPERAQFFTQYPNWTLRKEELIRAGKSIPQEGNGLQLFRNAVAYVKERWGMEHA